MSFRKVVNISRNVITTQKKIKFMHMFNIAEANIDTQVKDEIVTMDAEGEESQVFSF